MKYNDQIIKKIKYNGRYIEKLNYNNTEVTFGSYNTEALQTFAEKPTINTGINNAEAIVNLHNGCMKLMIPDVSFGNAALGIGVSHIYNSMMDNDEIYKAKWTFMGYGMKINYQQYLIKVNDSLYYYIDGTGSRHEIVSAIEGTTFYDTSGLGLVLTENESEYILKDHENNFMNFNKTTGLITKITNNLDHKISIKYDNYRIIEVIKKADEKYRKMFFEYDDLDRLLYVKYGGADKYIEYEYIANTNLLKRIIKKALNEQELIVQLTYDDNKRIIQVNNITKQILEFEYYDDKIYKIKEGVINNNNNIEIIKIQKIQYNDTNSEVTTRLCKDTFVANELQEIKMVYNFNYKGDFLTSYEIYKNQKTLSYVSVSPSSKSGTRLFNQETNKNISSFNGTKISNLDNASAYTDNKGYPLNDFNTYNCDTIRQLINDIEIPLTYTFSFWYKVETMPSTGINLRLYLKDDFFIEKKLEDAQDWKLVSFEMELSKTFTANYIKSYIIASKSYPFKIKIADFRATHNLMNLKIKEGTYENDIRSISMVYAGQHYIIKDVREVVSDNEYFISARDILWNLLETNKGTLNFYLNNGKKMIKSQIPNIRFDANKGHYIFNKDLAEISFFNEVIKDSKIKIQSFFCCEQIGNYCLNREKIIVYKEGMETSIIEKQRNKANLILEENDEYGIKTYYTYNAFGQIINKKVISSDKALMLKYEYQYDENGNLIQSKLPNNSTVNYLEDEIYGNLKSIISANGDLKTDYDYNKLNDRITTIKHFTGLNHNSLYNALSFDYNIKGQTQKITRSDGENYSFTYDVYGNLQNYNINNNLIQKNSVLFTNDGKITIQEYANTEIKSNSNYDIYGRLISKSEVRISGSAEEKLQNTFEDHAGNASSGSLIRKTKDNHSNITYNFDYDMNENLFKYYFSGNGMSGSVEALNEQNVNGIKYIYKYGDTEQKVIIAYDEDKHIAPRIISERNEFFSTSKKKYTYDKLGRLVTITEENSGTTTFKYKDVGLFENYTLTTNYVETITMLYPNRTPSNLVYTLFYDSSGNIINVKKNNSNGNLVNPNKTDYAYDSLGRLERVDDELGYYSKKYSYDKFGNRQNEFIANYTKNSSINANITKTYLYDNKFKDRLMNITVQETGKSAINYFFTYNTIGNPTKYKSKSAIEEEINMTWQRAYLLESYNHINGKTRYKYNANGIRIEKNYENNKNEEIRVKHYLDGTKICADEIFSSKNNRTYMFHYKYNHTGIIGMFYNGFNFNFEKDALGNIIKIYTEITDNLVAEYSYDIWGNCTTKYIHESYLYLEFNPFRWKGHYFDYDSGFYYINSNYYDPETGRYINCNSIIDIMTNNSKLFESTYCIENNNPVMFAQNLDTNEPQLKLNVKTEKKEKNIAVLIFGAILLLISLIISILFPPCGVGLVTISILIFAGTTILLVFAIAELIEAFTYVNFIRDGLGWDMSTYNKVKIGITIAVVILTIASIFLPRVHCFKKGTLVHSKEGDKEIEKIMIGDLVWAYDEKTGVKSLKKVVKLFRNGKEFSPTQDIGEGVKDWIKVGVTKENNNEEIDLITCTFEHPFYVLNADSSRNTVLFEGKEESKAEGSWIASKDLRVGDKLLLSSGENAIISSLEVEHYDEPQTTYNFEVADYHTYYVGTEGILVHNACGGDLIDDGIGFDTFDELKAHMGPAGEGKEWHHIVEQNQMKHSGFTAKQIHNTNNIRAVDVGVHRKISSFYSSRSGQFSRFRIGLRGTSFEHQYSEGIRILQMFGG